jgi:hypothetical protein
MQQDDKDTITTTGWLMIAGTLGVFIPYTMLTIQFAGVLLSEHIGQLFTIIWTVAIAIALFKAGLITNWLKLMGLVGSLIYLLAQSDLLGTVIPNFPGVPMAGSIGSTLWLVWLLLVGMNLIRVGKAKIKLISTLKFKH